MNAVFPVQQSRIGRHPVQLGFTLVELMIVVAIIAILAAIAYPSYIRYVERSRRADAKTALLDLAVRQERYFSTHNTYSSSAVDLGYGTGSTFPINVNISGGRINYTLNFSGSVTQGAFTATATPTGPQTSDGCATYVINQLGVQSNQSNTVTSGCW